MGLGIYNSATGKFDLVLSIRYDATDDENNTNDIDQWEVAFERASRLLYDATDGQHQLGNIYVFNNDSLNGNVADAWLMLDDLTATQIDSTDGSSSNPGEPVIGALNWHIVFASSIKYRPFMIVHELGHYLYGLCDEYMLDQYNSGGHCIGPMFVGGTPTANSCIMEGRWDDGDHFGSDGVGGPFIPGRVSEFCSQKDPAEAEPTAGYHTYDNFQEKIHHPSPDPNPYAHFSCWDTMMNAHRQPDPPAETFGLVYPPSRLPEEAAHQDDAAPINWIVMGQQQRFMLIVDRSGSMTGSKLEETKGGLDFWVDAALARFSSDRIGIVTYSSTTLNPLTLQAITAANINTLHDDIIPNISAGGLTAIGDALRRGLDLILNDIAGSSDRGQNAMVLLTDGIHNAGTETPDDVLPDLISNGVQVYTIGIGTDVNSNLLQDIAHRTGGEYFEVDYDPSAPTPPTQIKEAVINLEGVAHGGGLVADITGSTNPGIREESAYIEQDSKKATFTLSWDNPNALLSLELLSPDGVSITLDSMPANVHAVYNQGTYMGFQVEQPVMGTWILRVNPEKEVDEIVHFRLIVFSENPHISGGLISPSNLCQTGIALPIQFRLYYDLPLTGLDVNGRILTPDGIDIPLEFNDEGNIELGDIMPGDGVYGAIFQGTNKAGNYTIKMSVDSDGESVSYGKVGMDSGGNGDDKPDIPVFHREFTRTVGVGELPHKHITSNPGSSYPGTTLQVTLKGENTHFLQGSTSADFGEGIHADSLEVVDKHTALAKLYIDKNAAYGPRTVTVTTDRYQEKIEVEGGFEVTKRKWIWPKEWIIRLLIFLISLIMGLLLRSSGILTRVP
jgi:uncharacterized protein YegL